MNQIGKYAFIAGVVLSIVGAFIQLDWIWIVLAVLGLVVGILNITASERKGFIIAAIGLLLSSESLRGLPGIGEQITGIFSNLVVFTGPALLIVSLQALFSSAKD